MVVVGDFNGTIDFGGDSFSSNGSTIDAFVAVLGADGSHRFSMRFGGGAYDEVTGVATGKNGDIALGGLFWGLLEDLGEDKNAGASDDALLARLAPDTSHLWSEHFGEHGTQQRGFDVAVDDHDNVVLVGSNDGTIDFGGGGIATAGADDAFVVKRAADGTLLWGAAFGDAAAQQATAVAVALDGHIVIAGRFSGAISFGESNLSTSDANGDMFVATLAP
jgi:hypothetical protein